MVPHLQDLEADLQYLFKKHNLRLLKDDGMCIFRMGNADAYYVCFTDETGKVWPPIKDDTP